MEKKYAISTEVETLKKVWNLLKEVNLEWLLSGDKSKVDIPVALNGLLSEGKLNEICQIITGSGDDFEKKDLKEVVVIVKDFFIGITSLFQELRVG